MNFIEGVNGSKDDYYEKTIFDPNIGYFIPLTTAICAPELDASQFQAP